METTRHKRELRDKIKEHIACITPEERNTKSECIAGNIVNTSFYRDAHVVMTYMPMPDEVDITSVIENALFKKKKVLVPKCNRHNGTIISCVIENVTSDLKAGYAGISEPHSEVPVEAETIDLILVPGRAFDLQGHRLGRGGGHYDRFLLKCKNAVKVGIAFELQIVSALKRYTHDVQMDFVVTENRIIKKLTRNKEE